MLLLADSKAGWLAGWSLAASFEQRPRAKLHQQRGETRCKQTGADHMRCGSRSANRTNEARQHNKRTSSAHFSSVRSAVASATARAFGKHQSLSCWHHLGTIQSYYIIVIFILSLMATLTFKLIVIKSSNSISPFS